MAFIEADDFRQMTIVAWNEMIKSIRGKKLLIFLVIIALMLALPLVISVGFGGELYRAPQQYLGNYTSFLLIILIISASLFTSTTLVSEFENRTALLIFTRPVKRTTIFAGKFIGCFILQWAVIALFYVGMTMIAVIFKADGYSIPFGDIITSFLLATLALLAISSLSVLFSSLVKRSSTASILSFVMFLMIIPMIEVSVLLGIHGMLETIKFEWYMFDSVASFASDVFGISDNVFASTAPEIIGYAMIWCVIPLIAALYFFRKRDV